uniref:Uncharacterized protein n=1 Tax=Trichobilharzia regenti TaxID=157069 RepID=A0AA85JP05_TRIRE|nr:unnamed protein product [Trichobilharzia regenti]
MERILVSYGHKNDWISNFNVESILNTVVSNIPGSFWWYDSYLIDSPENFKHYYWLKVPEYSLSDNNGLYCERKHYTERFLARLIVLRYNESINISGVTITPQSHNQVICIDSYAPKNGGHWKVLWSDLQRELQIYIPLEDNNSYRVTRLLSNEPIQLGPCLRLIGWVSGHTYSPETKDDTTPGSQTYNWCFLIPIDLDHLHNVTVFLLPSEIKDLSNTPPTQHLESIRLVGGIDENINHLNTSLRELFTAIKRANFTYYKQSSYTETFNNNNTNTKKDNNFFTISSLFEFGTRLTIITQPYNTTKKQSYMHSMGIDSVCSLDSLNYRCRTADSRKFSQYTYIKTQNGRPVYKNGAFIEQAKKTAKEEQSEYTNGEKHSHNQPFIIDHINNMDLNQRHFVSCMQHHVTISCDTNALSLEKDVNGIETKCFTDVYPLEELEVVSSKQTIPPPWLSGFNKSESTSSHVNSQKGSDQSAVFTSSELSASMIEPDQVNTRSSVDGQQNIPDSLTVYSVFSNPTEEYESRTNLLINLLGELNLLSQIVLCTENENESHTYDVPEICKSILQGLTELLNEEEDEEDICDQEYSLPSQSAEQKDQINVASSMNNTVVTTGKRNDVSEICVPLPTVCRVKSPIRLLVFYFEILSELMELKDHENKCSEDNQEDISTLMDMSAGVLRLLDIDDNDDKNNYDNNSDNNNEGGEADATNLSCYRTCENAMHTLIRLQDAWIAAPVIIEMLDTTGVSKSFHGSMNPTVEIYETAKLYLTRIQSALNKQRCDMRNLISNDLNSLQEKSTDLFVEESSVENFENLCKVSIKCLIRV